MSTAQLTSLPSQPDPPTGVFYLGGPGVTVYGRMMPDQSILLEIRCQATWQLEKLIGFIDDHLRGPQGEHT